jgi:hypothetical protein
MSFQHMRFEDFFGEHCVSTEQAPGAACTRLEMDSVTLESLVTIAGILERSAGSEAAVRLAALALRGALDRIICVPEGDGMS